MGLKKAIRETIYFLVRYTTVPFLIRQIVQKKTVAVLTFHNIKYKTAELLFDFIKKNYHPISLSQYIDILYKDNTTGLPQRGIIVTLDDGYKENYNILPLAEEYHIIPTIFLCSSVVDTNQKLWFNVVGNKKEKRKLKRISDEERMKFFFSYPKDMIDNVPVRTFLNRTELDEMKDFFEFQSHTVTHPILPKCPDKKSEEEISLSKKMLEEKFGLSISALAFPNGSFTSREIGYLRKAGYKCGLTLNFDYNTSQSDPFQISRIPLNDDAGIHEIAVKTSGLYDMLIKWIFPIRHY